jgi:phosphoribosylanthranilate isomerase
MQAMPAPFIKICCISSVDEAQLALAHGVSGIGLVSEMPSGPGVIADALRQVAPFGLDVCSGVRTDGHLDPDKLQRFVAAARSWPTS